MQCSGVLSRSALLFLVLLPASAQSVLSVHSGVLNYFEGSLFLDNQAITEKFGTFPSIKEGSTLRTEKGRAEVLLTPGVFLRIDEDSSVRMISTALSDTRAELVSGSAILDSLDAASDKSVGLSFKGGEVRFSRKGVYRFDSDPAGVLHVYQGEAEVTQDGKKSVVDNSHLYFFSAAASTNKFGEDTDDDFSRWAEARSGAITAENQLSAEAARDPGDLDNGAASSADAGPLFGLPSYSDAVPGVFVPDGVFFNPYLPGGAGLWGASPVFPIYIFGHYRNPAYPRPPNRPNGASWLSGEHWRPRPGYPHSPVSTAGFSLPFIPRSPSFSPRPFPARIGVGSYGFSHSVAAPASRPGVAHMAGHAGAHR